MSSVSWPGVAEHRYSACKPVPRQYYPFPSYFNFPNSEEQKLANLKAMQAQQLNWEFFTNQLEILSTGQRLTSEF